MMLSPPQKSTTDRHCTSLTGNSTTKHWESWSSKLSYYFTKGNLRCIRISTFKINGLTSIIICDRRNIQYVYSPSFCLGCNTQSLHIIIYIDCWKCFSFHQSASVLKYQLISQHALVEASTSDVWLASKLRGTVDWLIGQGLQLSLETYKLHTILKTWFKNNYKCWLITNNGK